MWACCELTEPDLTWAPDPAIASNKLPPRLLTDFIPFCVNCGKAKFMPTKSTISVNNTPKATLREVTVFQATWIPGLLLADTGATGRQPNPKNMGYLREYHKHNWRGMVDYLGSYPGRSCPAVRKRKVSQSVAALCVSLLFRMFRQCVEDHLS